MADLLKARLHSVEAGTALLGLSRSQIYEEFAAEEAEPGTGLRSVKVGRRRLIPDTAIDEYIAHLESRSTATQLD